LPCTPRRTCNGSKMSVAASMPSTALTPTLPPLALNASFSLLFAARAPVLAFSVCFF
jgi:hypothetical protein